MMMDELKFNTEMTDHPNDACSLIFGTSYLKKYFLFGLSYTLSRMLMLACRVSMFTNV